MKAIVYNRKTVYPQLQQLRQLLSECGVDCKEPQHDTASGVISLDTAFAICQQHRTALLSVLPTTPMHLRQRILNACFAKIGRNDRCPCGSTKKYKQCCK